MATNTATPFDAVEFAPNLLTVTAKLGITRVTFTETGIAGKYGCCIRCYNVKDEPILTTSSVWHFTDGDRSIANGGEMHGSCLLLLARTNPA